MKKNLFILFISIVFLTSCEDLSETVPVNPLPETTTKVEGKAVIKVLKRSGGWVALQEVLQPQYLITAPQREISWLDDHFSETANYKPPQDWSLIDAVVHPSGHVSAVIINVDIKRIPLLQIKMLRFKSNGSVVESELQPLPGTGQRTRYFPGSLDRIRLTAYHEDVYVVARWDFNDVEASRIRFTGNQFKTEWQTQVEPDAYAGTFGIIGGGYDNFHQGDRYFFVYSGVDSKGNLYVAVPSHEDLLSSHDIKFHENLSAGTDPASYDWGIAILTKISSQGERQYSKLEGMSTKKRLINMRVSDENVFLLGRVKTGSASNAWDAWILSAEAMTGDLNYESTIDIQDGDMFWDLNPVQGGGVLAVGTTAYTQNPSGLSVSDIRTATAILLDAQGSKIKEIELPQGPAERGSEALYVSLLNNGSAVFAGAHNAPGTHAAVYADGFIAVRDFSLE